MRKTLLTFALVACASPAFAQAAQQGKDNDPTHKVAGGISASGWTGRLDPQSERRGMKIDDAKFSAMGGGFHITSGPAAIYWNPKDMMKGTYTASGSFTQTKMGMHPEAYGLFIGGQNLTDSTETYLYFETRGDGKYLINHRAGNDVQFSSVLEEKSVRVLTKTLAECARSGAAPPALPQPEAPPATPPTTPPATGGGA